MFCQEGPVSAAQLPADEPQRLATLEAYEILDTPPDRSFDRLVQLAAEHFDAPISAVSLTDADRQWFKASVGVTATETPREYAFCAHAIAQANEVFVVENALCDPRFADNPFVTGDPSIRFYAGAPIRAANGQPLGTICVLDRKPRQLGTAGQKFLANLAGSVGSMLDLHRQNLILRDFSGRDPLTGLANRRVFGTALATACAAAAQGDTFGLLAIDLDHFKKINDEHGHEVGDMLLLEVAARLRHVVRAKDLVARLGGDEFAVIAGGPIDAAGAATLARRIVNAFAPVLTAGDRAVPIEASIGVALAPAHGSDARAIAKAADLALYAGKRGGRGAIIMARGLEPEQPDGRSSLDGALREAIANQTLSLHWQPYFPSRSSHPGGFEALLRWTPAGGDPVPPMEIIAIAENGGYIAELDAMVLRQACMAAASWPTPLRVSVNMSARWFNGGDLIGLVAAALEASGLAPERLTIELTEQTLVRHTERSRHLIAGLHAAGVSLALDDFGTGYASLGYLSSFEFDTVKLDRSFVGGIGTNPRAEAVIHAIVALARALDMAVCAEGVETPEQLRFLQNAGCDLIQGFLLGRPEAAIVWPPAEAAGAPEVNDREVNDPERQIAAE
jgi:diguanylate cyclase (GGDEF)-like protein